METQTPQSRTDINCLWVEIPELLQDKDLLPDDVSMYIHPDGETIDFTMNKETTYVVVLRWDEGKEAYTAVTYNLPTLIEKYGIEYIGRILHTVGVLQSILNYR